MKHLILMTAGIVALGCATLDATAATAAVLTNAVTNFSASGSAQAGLYCYVTNSGTTGVTITSVKFYDNGANGYVPTPVNGANCVGVLAPHQSCMMGLTTGVTSFSFYRCEVVASAVTALRGQLMRSRKHAPSPCDAEDDYS